MTRARELGTLRHLVGRFVGALWPGGPSVGEETWALDFLLPGERALWRRMSGPDRRHAIGVARDALVLLEQGVPAYRCAGQAANVGGRGAVAGGRARGPGDPGGGGAVSPTKGVGGGSNDHVSGSGGMVVEQAGVSARAVVAGALLHDVGKVESGFGTLARAVVTGLALVVGRERIGGPDEAVARWPGWRGRVQRYFHHDRIGGELLRRAGSDPLTVAWAEQHHLPADRWTVERRVGEALKAADGD